MMDRAVTIGTVTVAIGTSSSGKEQLPHAWAITTATFKVFRNVAAHSLHCLPLNFEPQALISFVLMHK